MIIGQTVSHYRIVSKIGQGGMGEVYQAKDLTLGRDVAIKVLPEEFTGEPDRVARFQREAKLLASLNHTNIAAIYGLERSDGTNFLVLELVEGQTLADLLKRGPIAVEESLKLALQIAEALEAAHEKGVIHRDLKPANIKVTPEGKVKVLDFGLAKAFAGEQAELNLSNSPTLSNAATQQGVILGTAAYMPPEQARGKPVDKRADIWAFGCVLYEMLTGRQTWTGATVTDIIAAALAKDPDFTSLPSNIHPRIRELLSRCLQKDPTERFRDAGDVRGEIKQLLADPKGVMVQPVTAAEPRTRLRTILPWIAAAVVLTAIFAGLAVWKLKPPEPRQVTRLYYELPKDQQFGYLGERALAISPDGRKLVYKTSTGLYLRPMDELDARLIPGTGENPLRPFFSHDGKWVGYWSEAAKGLKKIAISGAGAPVILTDASSFGSFSWGADDAIVFGTSGKGIMRISANGGTPELIIKEENESLGHPQILPDGKSVLFTSAVLQRVKIMVKSLKSGGRKELFQGDAAQYLTTGHIVYAVDNNLFAVPFNLDRLEVTGRPALVVEGVSRAIGAPQYAVSDSGTLAYIPGTVAAQRTLLWVDMKGKEEPLAASPNNYTNPKISPDGTKVAFTIGNFIGGDIWIWDIVRETMTRLTFDTGTTPLWTPDGKRIAYNSRREGNAKIYWEAADGTGKIEPLGSVPGFPFLSSWSGNGKTLIIAAIDGSIMALSIEGEHKYRPLLQEKYAVLQPRISQDGRWIAYTSNESGKNEVYVRPFPDLDKGRWQVSRGGGESPLWSRDGREIFYRSADAVMAVSVKTDPALSLETPKILFRGTYVSYSAHPEAIEINPWDISPDCKRFLMMKEVGANTSEGGGARRINIVLNWFEELKQRVPVK